MARQLASCAAAVPTGRPDGPIGLVASGHADVGACPAAAPAGAGVSGRSPPRRIGLAGWKQITARVVEGVRVNQVPLLAAGVVFYAMLALIPAMVAVISIYGMVVSPQQAAHQVDTLTKTLPPEARHLVSEQLQTVAKASTTHLSLGTVLGLALALWGASSAVRWTMTALSLVYDESETRGYLQLRTEALLLTAAALTTLSVSLAILFGLPALLDAMGLGEAGRTVARIARYPLLGTVVLLGLALLYRFGPDRRHPQWRWVPYGSLLATALWLAGSAGLSLYATSVDKFSAAGTYGALGAVIVLLLWLWLIAFAVLLGGEVNAEVEHQVHGGTPADDEVAGWPSVSREALEERSGLDPRAGTVDRQQDAIDK
jgi:membrane protein